jgi:hypothetical protein
MTYSFRGLKAPAPSAIPNTLFYPSQVGNAGAGLLRIAALPHSFT